MFSSFWGSGSKAANNSNDNDNGRQESSSNNTSDTSGMSASTSSTSISSNLSGRSFIKPGREGEQQRVQALEAQVQQLASTAAAAVDRAENLEEELKSLRSKSQSDLERSNSSATTNSTAQSVSTANYETDLSSPEAPSFNDSWEHRKRIQELEEAVQREQQLRIESERREKQTLAKLQTTTSKDPEKDNRLHQLEIAVKAIHRAREVLYPKSNSKYVYI